MKWRVCCSITAYRSTWKDTSSRGTLYVSLRGRPAFGVVVDLDHTSPVEVTQPITRLVDARPVVAPVMLELARWIAAYYRCTSAGPCPHAAPRSGPQGRDHGRPVERRAAGGRG